jgi:anti-sigma B factor antagonist
MEINIKNYGISGIYVNAAGRLDLDSAVEYGSKIKDAIDDAQESVTEVVLDFSEITFISSFGLKVILEIYKELKNQNGTVKIKNVSEQIKSSFTMVGFDKFITFE